MINNLTIQKYKGLVDLTLDNFSRVNLIVGLNNSGKTSILDAIYHYYFLDTSSDKWQVKGESNDAQTPNVEYIKPFSYLITEYVPLLPQLQPEIVELLHSIDPNIVGLEVGEDNTLYILHSTCGKMRLADSGDCVRRILRIALAVGKLEKGTGGVLLIDEIETSIHTKSLLLFFDWLINLTSLLDIQLFVTTHSLEVIDTMLTASEDLCIYKLSNNCGKRIGYNQLTRMRENLQLEVRW